MKEVKLQNGMAKASNVDHKCQILFLLSTFWAFGLFGVIKYINVILAWYVAILSLSNLDNFSFSLFTPPCLLLEALLGV